MNKNILASLGVCILCFVLTGCSVKSYQVLEERADQDLDEGNRGYLSGKPEFSDEKPRKTTRPRQVFEIEFGASSQEELEVKKAEKEIKAAQTATPATRGTQISKREAVVVRVPAEVANAEPKTIMQKYTVVEGDTLQKISQKFYGTTRRWKEIYDVNKKMLKNSERIYPGQVIEVLVKEQALGK